MPFLSETTPSFYYTKCHLKGRRPTFEAALRRGGSFAKQHFVPVCSLKNHKTEHYGIATLSPPLRLPNPPQMPQKEAAPGFLFAGVVA